jgi:EmrB/QacA subfamily drug resistance transporter
MPRGPKFVAALSALSMAAVLSAIDQTVVSTALPHIVDSLQGAHLLGWVFTAYFLGATATVAVVGKLADVFGRRRVFIVSIALFCVGSLLCGLATSMPLLVAFRGLQGIGAGGLQTCALIVMGDMFAPRARGQWQVINSIGFATASAIGPSVGGLLSDNFSWRWIFLLNVPVCLATVAALLYGLTAGQRPAVRPKIDWAGGTWSMVAVVALLLGLTLGGRDYAWTSPEIMALGVAAACASLLLYRAEQRAAEPVIPGNLLRGNVRALSCIASFGNSMVWFGLILLVPVRLQLVLGNSATVAGALLTPGIVMGPLGSVCAGQLLSRTGRYRLPSVIAGVLQVVGLAMLLFSPATSGEPWVIVAFVIASLGTGFGGPTFMIMYQNAIPQKQLGAGVGLMSLFRQFGASVGTALAGSIVGAGVIAAGSGQVDMAPFVQSAFVLPFAGALAVLVAAWFTANRPLRTTLDETEEHATTDRGDLTRRVAALDHL